MAPCLFLNVSKQCGWGLGTWDLGVYMFFKCMCKSSHASHGHQHLACSNSKVMHTSHTTLPSFEPGPVVCCSKKIWVLNFFRLRLAWNECSPQAHSRTHAISLGSLWESEKVRVLSKQRGTLRRCWEGMKNARKFVLYCTALSTIRVSVCCNFSLNACFIRNHTWTTTKSKRVRKGGDPGWPHNQVVLLKTRGVMWGTISQNTLVLKSYVRKTGFRLFEAWFRHTGVGIWAWKRHKSCDKFST